MSDILKEPYELSIWQTSFEEGLYKNLMPPLNKAYEDCWEVFGVGKGNFLEPLQDWEELYFQNTRVSTYECRTKQFPNNLTKSNYTLFVEIQNLKSINLLDEEYPTCTLQLVDNDNILSFIEEIRLGNGTAKFELSSLAGKSIRLFLRLPGGKTKNGRKIVSELNFQIRVSLFEGKIETVPYPFPKYDGETQSRVKKETKLCIIGSNLMTAPNRATVPVVKTNVNGEKTLTFSLYAKYFDTNSGEFLENPFIKFLHNESYLKLCRGTGEEARWEEYIVKNIVENSVTKAFSYTAKRAAAIELGKAGYNLEFNANLMNNQGTAAELTKRVFAGTDWIVDENNFDKFWGVAVEPVYEATLGTSEMGIPADLNCIRQAKKDSYDLYYNEIQSDPAPKAIAAETKIYIPYSSYQNREKNGYIQFLYPEGDNIEVDDSGIIYGASSYIYTNFSDNFLFNVKIAQGYKGDHLEKRSKTKYIKNLNRVVQEGTISGKPIYKMIDVEYQTSDSLSELIVNGRNFESTEGWRVGGAKAHIALSSEGDLLKDIVADSYTTKLVLTASDSSQYFYNAGIRSNASVINNFTEGEEYCVELDADNYDNLESLTIASYAYVNNEISLDVPIFKFKEFKREEESLIYIGTCLESISNKELTEGFEGKNIGLFLQVKGDKSIKINSISLFEKKLKDKGDLYKPGDAIDVKVITKEIYYDPSLEVNDQALSLSELVPCNGSGFIPSYYENYDKISSIEISKSNRFNILQEICEAFECWADLQIEHNEDGSIRNKKVVLKNFIGANKEIGFSYGLNLKDIQRTLVSDQIVTKLIVEPNNNENALNGFATIARAENNLSKDTAIYNFDYYINQGALDREETTEDLYGEQGVIYRLGLINSKMMELNSELIANQIEAFQLQSETTTLKEAFSATQEEILQLQENFYDLTGKSVGNPTETELQEYEKNSVLKDILINLSFQQKKLNKLSGDMAVCAVSLLKNHLKLRELEKKIEDYKQDQQNYLNSFNNKYSNYIQEGTWTDESYYDDDLYYLDAQNVLYASAFPKVSYTINVIDVFPLGEQYQQFKFSVGDKTYIEDTEFFGWNAAGTFPYREEVVISEMEEHLDSPEQNKITVQNYKTQFEDLFQRISATTQSLQYAAGAYQRAANKITSTNSIDAETVQNSFLQGIIDIQNMGNMSVKWTSEGLLISNQSDPNNKLRLSNVGITQSSDGGETWKTVLLAGRGITANSIVTGTLDANKISIKSGDHAAFIWDARGLRAYGTTWKQDGTLASIDYNTYIEFNDRGLIAYKLENGSLTQPFKLTSKGELELTGKITAKEGYIADWKIDSGGLIKGTEAWLIPEGVDVNIGTKEAPKIISVSFKAGDNFKVTTEGKLYATEADISGHIKAGSGLIGGWIIDSGILKNSSNNPTLWLAPGGYEGTFCKETDEEETKDFVFFANGNFGVDIDGNLYANNAKIIGHVDATSGSIGGWMINEGVIYNTVSDTNALVWLAPDGIPLDGSDQTTKYVFYANGKFKVDTDGKLYATEADISGHISANTGSIGDWFLQDRILTNQGEGKIWLAPGGHTGTIMEGTEDEYEDRFVFYANDNFGVNTDGKLYANDARIFGEIRATTGKIGNWHIIGNRLSSTDENSSSGIILDATYSTIYSKQFDASNSGDGWKITNDEAIFNNITLRGALKCAILEYAEVQAIGGIMMVRPATTIKGYKVIEEINEEQTKTYLDLVVENPYWFNEGDWCKITTEADGDNIIKTDAEGKQILYSGINVNLFKLIEKIEQEETQVDGQEKVKISKLRFELNTDEEVDAAKGLNNIEGLGLISLGTSGSIGLGLNSSGNHAMLPSQSFSVFSLEERLKETEGNTTWKYLEPHVILGKIPNNPEKYGSLADTYGLYADNVYLKGVIVAEGSSIGGMDVSKVIDFTEKAEQQERYQIIITTSNGETFVDEDNIDEATTLTCKVLDNYTNEEITENLTYQWYKNNILIENETKSTLYTLVDLGATTYSCEVKIGD